MKDARAEIEQIDAGLKSRTQALAERGYDAEQVDAEIAADKAREKSLGLSFVARHRGPAIAPASDASVYRLPTRRRGGTGTDTVGTTNDRTLDGSITKTSRTLDSARVDQMRSARAGHAIDFIT